MKYKIYKFCMAAILALACAAQSPARAAEVMDWELVKANANIMSDSDQDRYAVTRAVNNTVIALRRVNTAPKDLGERWYHYMLAPVDSDWNWTHSYERQNSRSDSDYTFSGTLIGGVFLQDSDRVWGMGGLLDDPDGYMYYSTNHVEYYDEQLKATRLGYAAWGARHDFGALLMNGNLWVIGGKYLHDDCGNIREYNYADVWKSPDGQQWSRVTESAPWGPRFAMDVWAFNGKMYLYGGRNDTEYLYDMWSSSNGKDWSKVSSAPPWEARRQALAAETGRNVECRLNTILYHDQLWAFVFFDAYTKFASEIWHTDDMKAWTEVVAPSLGVYGKKNNIFLMDDFFYAYGRTDIWRFKPGYSRSAQCLQAPEPLVLEPGATQTVNLTMTNTGQIAWKNTLTAAGKQLYDKLGLADDPAGMWAEAYPRRDLPENTQINPGESFTFSFRLQAPQAPGTYTLTLQMLQEFVRSYGDPVQVTVTVTGDETRAHEGWARYE